jgi:hypothetical protein
MNCWLITLNFIVNQIWWFEANKIDKRERYKSFDCWKWTEWHQNQWRQYHDSVFSFTFCLLFSFIQLTEYHKQTNKQNEFSLLWSDHHQVAYRNLNFQLVFHCYVIKLRKQLKTFTIFIVTFLEMIQIFHLSKYPFVNLCVCSFQRIDSHFWVKTVEQIILNAMDSMYEVIFKRENVSFNDICQVIVNLIFFNKSVPFFIKYLISNCHIPIGMNYNHPNW